MDEEEEDDIDAVAYPVSGDTGDDPDADRDKDWGTVIGELWGDIGLFLGDISCCCCCCCCWKTALSQCCCWVTETLVPWDPERDSVDFPSPLKLFFLGLSLSRKLCLGCCCCCCPALPLPRNDPCAGCITLGDPMSALCGPNDGGDATANPFCGLFIGSGTARKKPVPFLGVVACVVAPAVHPPPLVTLLLCTLRPFCCCCCCNCNCDCCCCC